MVYFAGDQTDSSGHSMKDIGYLDRSTIFKIEIVAYENQSSFTGTEINRRASAMVTSSLTVVRLDSGA